MIETSKPSYNTAVPTRGKANIRVREALKEAGLRQWELAKLMGMGETTIVRYLREELPKEEQDKIINLIRKHKEEG